jgi:hypothetical protein
MSTRNLVATDVHNHRFFVLAEDEQKAKAVLTTHPRIDNVDRLEFTELKNGGSVPSESTGTGKKSAKAGANGSGNSEVMQIWPFEVKKYGVLDAGGDKLPGDHVIVDPAGEIYIKEGPILKDDTGAGGLSQVIYQFLGIYEQGYKFDTEVKTAIEAKRAAYHKYDKASVIHVVGPDFRGCPDETYGNAIEKLSRAYARVFDVAEGLKDCSVVRLPLISGGIFSGKFRHGAQKGDECFPELTARAIIAALGGRENLQKRYWICVHDTVGKQDERMMRALQWTERAKYVQYEGASTTGTPQSNAKYEDYQDENDESRHYRVISELQQNSKTAILVVVKSRRNGADGTYIGSRTFADENGIPRVDESKVSEFITDERGDPEKQVLLSWMCTISTNERTRVFRSTVGGYDLEKGACVVTGVHLAFIKSDEDGKKFSTVPVNDDTAVAFIASAEDQASMQARVRTGLRALHENKRKRVVIPVSSGGIQNHKKANFKVIVEKAALDVSNDFGIVILGPPD